MDIYGFDANVSLAKTHAAAQAKFCIHSFYWLVEWERAPKFMQHVAELNPKATKV
jgi:hypothetical protein